MWTLGFLFPLNSFHYLLQVVKLNPL